jgi:hypothetical protein
MKWFRSNLRLGSRLALCALAIQFLLSFGHFHGGSAQAASAPVHVGQTVAFAVTPAISHEPAGQPDHDCAICAVMALANTMLDAAPPDLVAPQAAGFAFLVVEVGFADLNSAVGAFQPRAPPIA